MTTPIINALDVAQQPPFVIGWQELDKFHRAIAALYEQQTKSDREAMLLDDCLSLILRHRMASGIGIFERNEKIQGCIEEIARLLLSVADGLNTRLPETFIGQCRNSTEESASRFYQVIAEAYITPDWKEPQKNAHSDTDSEGMGNNTPNGSETPPAGKETPKIAVMHPFIPKPVGRPLEPFAKTIADKYTESERATIEEYIKRELQAMTDPKAVIAMFVVCFSNKIIKQCPSYQQALSLIDIEGVGDREEKEKLCPFKQHQQYNRERNVYFDRDNNYLSLNETNIKQDNQISRFVLEAEQKLKDLKEALKPKKDKSKAKKNPASTA